MLRQYFINIFITITGLFLSLSSMASLPTKLLIKSISAQNEQKIWALTNDDISDIRYDNNGDKKIDEWFLSDKYVKINVYFANSKINKIKFSLKKSSTYVQVMYHVEKNNLLLKNATAIEKPVSFYTSGSFGGLGKKCSLSTKPNSIDVEDAEKMKEIFHKKELKSEWTKAIDPSCASAENTINTALNDAFLLDSLSSEKSNQFLSCLASNQDTSDLVTNFTNIASKGPKAEYIQKIKCKKTDQKDCENASFESKTGTVNLMISEPVCHSDMRSFYKKQIYHETLHSINPCLPDEAIDKVVDICSDTKLSQNLNSFPIIKTAFEKCSLLKESLEKKEKIQTAILSQSQSQNTIAETAQSKVTNIPKEIAEGAVSIPSPEPQTSGIAALNNSFAESRGPASASATIPLQHSMAMSAPFFKTAAKVFSNYKIEAPASNKPTLINNTLAKTRSAPKFEVTKSPAQKPDTFNNSTEALATQASNAPNEQGTPGQSNPEMGSSASAPASNAGAGARGIASAPGSSPSSSSNANSARPARASDSAIEKERSVVAQKIVKMSIPQARDYIKSNEEQLQRLRILILSQKNQRGGFQDPSRAAVRIQEVNGQLRIESE